MEFSQRHSATGIEDSDAGMCSILLAGIQPWGIGGGNIDPTGTRDLCKQYVADVEAMLAQIKSRL